MTTSRNKSLDIAKAIAIILVVLGHSIQYCSGLEKQEALSLGVSKFIYSFHVPLFMLVSGWLFYFTIQRHTAKEIVVGRLKTFIWPILTMTVVHLFMQYYEYRDELNTLRSVPLSLVNSLWFLWALAVATILMCVTHSIFRNRWWGYAVLVLLTLLVPDGSPIRAYMFLIPFFVTGFLSVRCKKLIGGGKTAVVPLLVILLLGVYVILLLRFEYSDFIYSGRYSILGDCNVSETLKEDAFRFLIGIAGSMMVISIIHLAIECCVLKGGALQLMSAIGKETLGIYVFQDLCFSLISPWLGKLDSHYAVINVLISFPIIFILSYQLTKWAKQSPIAGQLFLGRKV